jgi:hypothetical protein
MKHNSLSKRGFLPKTRFDGCSLELTDFVKKKLHLKTKVNVSIPEIGYYSLNKKHLNCSAKLPKTKSGKTFFFYTSLSTSRRIFEETSLASICTDFPCYKIYLNRISKNKNLDSLMSAATNMIG